MISHVCVLCVCKFCECMRLCVCVCVCVKQIKSHESIPYLCEIVCQTQRGTHTHIDIHIHDMTHAHVMCVPCASTRD